ncbi:hypothetical protein M0R89_18435 (plasmid) [Halorussus limi]|uniref:Uncharacterized protein n=1 Tax=Halorussus limi TaxID=2938695 RepID=A0A8U0HZD5_9EURY|nr:hypothetical protein [Halorussus limi]UPV76512.1 hypothetical protein M0R89_18435 [Halorussus limi]
MSEATESSDGTRTSSGATTNDAVTSDSSEGSGGGSRLAAKKNRLREWVLLDGQRLLIAASLLVIVAIVLVSVEALGWVPMERPQPVYYVFGGLISGNLTLITVVVSINQLLLGREFNSPGELESEMQSVIDYRREVEEHAGEVAPVTPLKFLELLFQNTRRETQRIGGMTFGPVGEDVRSEIDEVVESLTDHADDVLDRLGDSDADTFDVLSTTLTTNYAQEIHRVRKIRSRHGDDLPESVMTALDNLVDHLQKVDVARQYFKSLYLQEELSSLSRVLLYAGLPAELVSILVLLGLTARAGTGLTQYSAVLLPITVTIALLPLALLVAFIVRTATVTERTAATIPFTTPRQEK